MKSLRGAFLAIIALVVLCSAASAEERLKMSTTTSTQVEELKLLTKSNIHLHRDRIKK